MHYEVGVLVAQCAPDLSLETYEHLFVCFIPPAQVHWHRNINKMQVPPQSVSTELSDFVD